MTRSARRLGALASLALACGANAGGDVIIYVDDDAPPGGDGVAWASAYTDLQTALVDAASGVATEIRVAAGVYAPDVGGAETAGDREAAFSLRDGLAIRGGYRGIGGKGAPDDRDIDLFETVLTGDLDGNDGPDFADSEENSFHVVVALNVDDTAVLEGLTVRGGRADGPNFGPVPESQDQGSAVNVYHSTPHLIDCTFIGNFASNHGAVNDHGGATLLRCTFERNRSENLGAGLYVHTEVVSEAIACRFIDNTTAGKGGGAYNKGTPDASFVGCLFDGNEAAEGGGLYNELDAATTVAACTFVDNIAGTGGAMFNDMCRPTVSDCIFLTNTATTGDGGGAIWNEGGSPVVERCTFTGNAGRRGGGLYSGTGSTSITRDCIFTGNRVSEDGGGISSDSSSVAIIDCTFVGNIATAGSFVVGGGISNYFSDTRVSGCTFIGNSAREGFFAGGGAMYNESSFGAGFTVEGCLFRENSSDAGGAIYNFRSSPTLINCVIVDNVATAGDVSFGGAIANDFLSDTVITNCTIAGNTADEGGGIQNFRSLPRLTNTIVWGNTPDQIADGLESASRVDFSDVEGGWAGVGVRNIAADPDFIDPAAGDYRLGPDSPCIDAGHDWALPADVDDLDGDGDRIELLPLDHERAPRFTDDPDHADTGCAGPPVVDLGAYEHPAPAASVRQGDVDGDGVVGTGDLVDLLAAWGPCVDDCCPADLDRDGTVDVRDLVTLLASWS
jgi:hypothetical protein